MSDNPRTTTPNDDPLISPADAPGASLFESMGATVDAMRQLQTDLGARPYRVFVVRGVWSGGEVGRGEFQARPEVELLPTPLLDLRPVRFEHKAGGREERGTVTLREISPRYTEDEIAQIFHVKPGEQAFVEARHDERDGNTKRRRFTLASPPWRDVEKFQWVVRLSTEDAARTRSGKTPSGETFPERGKAI